MSPSWKVLAVVAIIAALVGAGAASIILAASAADPVLPTNPVMNIDNTDAVAGSISLTPGASQTVGGGTCDSIVTFNDESGSMQVQSVLQTPTGQIISVLANLTSHQSYSADDRSITGMCAGGGDKGYGVTLRAVGTGTTKTSGTYAISNPTSPIAQRCNPSNLMEVAPGQTVVLAATNGNSSISLCLNVLTGSGLQVYMSSASSTTSEPVAMLQAGDTIVLTTSGTISVEGPPSGNQPVNIIVAQN
jgi:hypothetical protein